ncbi:DNA cytosine methyltransferase [Candidatus Palauibacter sp.]|uniref:DNA cytosine methyltransferase n=1 Tax=Candidatus Palauibacter sp. TaxID=3101350 RepID=UPI003B5B89C1
MRTEDYGIPQSRHRVFVVCVREDLAPDVSADSLDSLLRLENVASTVSVADMIGKMPALRSRISCGDSEALWRSALPRVCDLGRRRRGGGSPAIHLRFPPLAARSSKVGYNGRKRRSCSPV